MPLPCRKTLVSASLAVLMGGCNMALLQTEDAPKAAPPAPAEKATPAPAVQSANPAPVQQSAVEPSNPSHGAKFGPALGEGATIDPTVEEVPPHAQLEQAKQEAAMGVDWSYSGSNGPDMWGSLSKDYNACKEGKEQSPVNLTLGKRENLIPVLYRYGDANVMQVPDPNLLRLGTSGGNAISINDMHYSLAEIVIHSPSEHSLNGKKSDAEVQYVHFGLDGTVAIVAYLLNKGGENQALDVLLSAMPGATDKPDQYVWPKVDLQKLMPEIRNYFAYVGSMTVPPCTENVKWVVMQETGSLSGQQLERIRQQFSNNARPLQNLGDRQVFNN